VKRHNRGFQTVSGHQRHFVSRDRVGQRASATEVHEFLEKNGNLTVAVFGIRADSLTLWLNHANLNHQLSIPLRGIFM
jgi:hypothetical protein